MVKSGRVANLRRELERFFQGARGVKAVIEAGRSSYTMVDVLADLGIETAVAHPKEVRAIAKAKVKTDERDSYKLAHLLRRVIFPRFTSGHGRIALARGSYVSGRFTWGSRRR